MSDHTPLKYLFLLVGRNPLPNYVAAHHLRKECQKIILLHSSETHFQAGMLKERLESEMGAMVETREMPPVDAGAIKKRIRDIVEEIDIKKTAKVELNYTGGTKPMAVHVYRALETLMEKRTAFSYLNAQDLQLYRDSAGSIAANDGTLKLSLEQLAAMHGFDLQRDGNARQEPQNLELATAVLEIHRETGGQEAWWTWRREGFPNDVLPDDANYPALHNFTFALSKLCESQITPEKLARLLGYQQLNQCGKWFNSGWLEDVVLAKTRRLQPRVGFTDEQFMGGLKLKPRADLTIKTPREFESDVLVVKGFQVFLISCIANSRSNESSETKKHLFEAYVRARQMGGDEARTAVVCLLDNPTAIENEINREWLPPGGVKVFGKEHLKNLASHLNQWMAQS